MRILLQFPKLAAVTLLLGVLPLNGHAILLSAAPEANQTISGPVTEVKLRFNSRIDVKRSRLVLRTPGGQERTLTSNQPSADTVSSGVADLSPGSYLLRWQVLA